MSSDNDGNQPADPMLPIVRLCTAAHNVQEAAREIIEGGFGFPSPRATVMISNATSLHAVLIGLGITIRELDQARQTTGIPIQDDLIGQMINAMRSGKHYDPDNSAIRDAQDSEE